MILDSGICSIFEKVNTSAPGFMPVFRFVRKAAGWYGVRNFSSRPTYLQQDKESTTVALKIRILQNLAVTNQDTVVLSDVPEVPASAVRYEVVRIYHGTDEQTGVPISDIDLEVVQA